MSKTNLTKSIDEMIDDIFAKSEDASNLNVASLASTKADEVANKAPKAESDASRGAGRPEQISDVPNVDQDGKRAGKYDSDIAKKQAEEEAEEAKKQADKNRSDQTMGRQEKDQMPVAKSLSAQEWEEFQAFKKAQSQKAQEEQLRKAQEQNRDLIKSAVKEATASFAKENEALRKSLNETQELVKAMAERPQRRKSVDGIQALEKSQADGDKGQQSFSKSEMLDVAEELVMKKAEGFKDEHLIELENTGFIFNKQARTVLETALKNRK